METISANGYNYDENGRTWIVQKATFEDFGGIDTATAKLSVVASFDTYDKAHHHYEQFCSGLQDDEGICESQNHSRATFYRIVEVHEGYSR